MTTNDVRSVPADPHGTTMSQRPAVVRDPTFHVHETRPPLGRFEYGPAALDGPLLYSTVMEQVRAGDTAAVNVA